MNRRLRHAGFTLVELMVSLVLGMLIVLALITLLVNTNRNNAELSNASRMAESGRIAVRLIASDLSHAGYWGGYLPDHDSLLFSGVPAPASAPGGTAPTAVPDPCLPYDPASWTPEHVANLIGIPVHVGDTAAPAAAPFCASVVASPRAGTDVLVVRRVEPCVAGSGTGECADTAAAATPDLYFQVSACNTDAAPYVLGTGGFTLRQRDCATASARRRLASTLYYVKQEGSGQPVLMRSQLAAGGAAPRHQPAQALVEGVEGLRVELGIDSLSDTGAAVSATTAIAWADPTVQNSPANRGDGNPDGVYVHCSQAVPCTAAQLMNAVSARVYVLVRAERPSAGHVDTKVYTMGSSTMGPFNDGYRRHLFSQTVRIVNVSARRETP